MSKLLKKCPSCGGQLHISVLACKKCGLELHGNFEIENEIFANLDPEKVGFLLCFLRNKGNLKRVQTQLDISYPTVKKELDELLVSLGLQEEQRMDELEVVDVENWNPVKNSKKASEIIKSKLKECGGRTTVYTLNGLPCEIGVSKDGTHLVSDKLPGSPYYRFEAFDCIVTLLLAQGGTAKKGNGRNFKLGQSHCDESTVVGYLARHYSGQSDGDSVFDPVFVLAAVLDWADIVHNGRGEISLTASYRTMLQEGE